DQRRRAFALCRQSREAGADQGRRRRRGGEEGLLPLNMRPCGRGQGESAVMKLACLTIAAILIVGAEPAPGQAAGPSRQGWRLTPNGFWAVRVRVTRAQEE